jgi:hypothetical protein
MGDPHIKRLAIVFGVLVLAILGGALYLSATPSPAGPLPPTPAPAANPAQSSSTSAPPKITWSQSQIEVSLAPTESASSDLTFVSSLGLSGAVVEPVPAISGLLSVQPNSFASVAAGASIGVHISFAIPSSTALGTYTGTMHIRVGSSTLPQTLKITVNVWNRVTDAAAGFSALFPPSLYNLTDANSPPDSFDLESSPTGVAIGGAVPNGSPVARSGFAVGIDASSFSVTSTFDVNQYLAAAYPNSSADAAASPILVCGRPGYQVFFSGEETGSWPVVIVYQNGRVYRFLYSSTDNNSDQTGLKAFNDVISNCSLQ